MSGLGSALFVKWIAYAKQRFGRRDDEPCGFSFRRIGEGQKREGIKVSGLCTLARTKTKHLLNSKGD